MIIIYDVEIEWYFFIEQYYYCIFECISDAQLK